MRNNNLKDLYVTYPFMPVASAPDWFSVVKFMRIMVTLPAAQPVVPSANGDWIVATLKALSPTEATVNIVCDTYVYDKDIQVPVFTSGIPTGNSYLYAGTVLPELSGLSYRIHPSCLVFQQEAPKLVIEGSTKNVPPAVMLEYNEGVPQWIHEDSVEAYEIDDVLWFENGHNVEVSGSSGNVLFTGAPGAGKGTWPEDPYIRDSSYNGYLGKALRSINGHSGIVLIQGDKSVEVIQDSIYRTKLKIKIQDPANGAQA